MHMYVNVLESVCVCALPFVINVKHSYTHKTACTRTLSSARTCTNKYSYNASNIHTHIHTAAAARMGTLSSTLTCINKHLCSAYKTHTQQRIRTHYQAPSPVPTSTHELRPRLSCSPQTLVLVGPFSVHIFGQACACFGHACAGFGQAGHYVC